MTNCVSEIGVFGVMPAIPFITSKFPSPLPTVAAPLAPDRQIWTAARTMVGGVSRGFVVRRFCHVAVEPGAVCWSSFGCVHGARV